MGATGLPVIAGPYGYQGLVPIRIDKSSPHGERWLQELIFEHPRALPVADIEPGFGDLIPIAMEITCAQGRIDNLYLTPRGDIVVVETKLWVNPEARRHVVAQTLDYAAALSAMGYEMFEAAVLRGETRIPKAGSIYQMVADHPEALAEDRFIDAVASNLRRGRMLMLAVGDGIREEAQALADLLESHAGAHFTFALVELTPYRLGDSDEVLVVPATLLRTTVIERGIVVIEDTRSYFQPALPAVGTDARGQTLTEIQFFELMGMRDPRLPGALRRFIAGLETMHGQHEIARTLRFRLETDGLPRPASLGYIDRTGKLWTDTVALNLPIDPALRYLQRLADLVGGQVAFSGEKRNPHVVVEGKAAPTIERLLPDHLDAWLEAIRELDEALTPAYA